MFQPLFDQFCPIRTRYMTGMPASPTVPLPCWSLSDRLLSGFIKWGWFLSHSVIPVNKYGFILLCSNNTHSNSFVLNWLPSYFWWQQPATCLHWIRMSCHHLKNLMLQKSVCTLLKVNCHAFYNFDFFLYFCYRYFRKSWNQMGVAHWKLTPLFVTVPLIHWFN